jgi:hypothetical protein
VRRFVAATVPIFILAWHPLHYRCEERGYDQAIQVTTAGQTWPEGWTVGVRRDGIRPGDQAAIDVLAQDCPLEDVLQDVKERWSLRPYGGGPLLVRAGAKFEKGVLVERPDEAATKDAA